MNENENNTYININKVAEAKGLKSNRSLRLEINKPESKYIAREVKVNGGTSYEDIEIIIVDEGEQDECRRIIDEYESKDSTVVYI